MKIITIVLSVMLLGGCSTTKGQEIDNEQKSNLVNNIENNSNQVYINKTYILIKEMENSIDLKDLDLFYIKYKAVM